MGAEMRRWWRWTLPMVARPGECASCLKGAGVLPSFAWSPQEGSLAQGHSGWGQLSPRAVYPRSSPGGSGARQLPVGPVSPPPPPSKVAIISESGEVYTIQLSPCVGAQGRAPSHIPQDLGYSRSWTLLGPTPTRQRSLGCPGPASKHSAGKGTLGWIPQVWLLSGGWRGLKCFLPAGPRGMSSSK